MKLLLTEYRKLAFRRKIKGDIRHKNRFKNKALSSSKHSSLGFSDYEFDSNSGRNIPTADAFPVNYGRGTRSHYFKRVCNKKVRKRLDIPSFGAYRKCTEFWWEIL